MKKIKPFITATALLALIGTVGAMEHEVIGILQGLIQMAASVLVLYRVRRIKKTKWEDMNNG